MRLPVAARRPSWTSQTQRSPATWGSREGAGIVAEGLCHEIVETHIPQHTPILSQPLWDGLVAKLREKFDLEQGIAILDPRGFLERLPRG